MTEVTIGLARHALGGGEAIAFVDNGPVALSGNRTTTPITGTGAVYGSPCPAGSGLVCTSPDGIRQVHSNLLQLLRPSKPYFRGEKLWTPSSYGASPVAEPDGAPPRASRRSAVMTS